MSHKFKIILFTLSILFLLGCSHNNQNQKDTRRGIESLAFALFEGKEFYDWTSDRIPLVSAHRGGPYLGYPENAIETFDHIYSYTPAIIECDIAMTKDSVLIMMHDNTLDRTTNGSGQVSAKLYDEIKSLKLKDNEGNLTSYSIPTLDEVLRWSKGKALLTLDVKHGVPFEMVVEKIQSFGVEQTAAVITYNADAAAEVYSLDNSLMISVSLGSIESYEAHSAKGIPDENMIAFVGVSEPEPSLYEFLHDKGIYTILGVLGNLDKKAISKGDSLYSGFIERGADILATDRPLEAMKIIEPYQVKSSSKNKFFNW